MNENNLIERLKKIRRLLNLTQKEFAQKLGVKWFRVRDIELGKQNITIELATKLEEIFSVNIRWLLTGKGEMFLNENGPKFVQNQYNGSQNQQYQANTINIGSLSELTPPELKEDKERDIELNDLRLSLIPMVEAKLSAGGGSFLTSDEIKGYYAFRQDFLRQISVDPNKAVLMKVMGDSMSPLIDEDDTVLVDLMDKSLIEGKIYAIGYGETILVKRIELRFPDQIALKSENTKYSDMVISQEDFYRSAVIGRIKWLAKIL